MIWKNQVDINVLNQMAKGTMMEHLGIEIIAIGEDYLKATMPVDHRTLQPMGLLHGGASVALSESMGSFASVLLLDDIEKEAIVGIEIKANHLKSVKTGKVTSITSPIKIGKRIQVWETRIHDEDNNLICISVLSTMRLKRI